MTDVRIAHLRKRYRIPAHLVTERTRLDRVLASAMDDELFEAALERAGIPADEEICLRRVEWLVRVDDAQADARLAVTWSVALADAIAQYVTKGGADVVRYRTRYLAFLDMACSAMSGDVERAWAWRALGIWRAPDALQVNEARAEVLSALAREPRWAPSVLATLAGRNLLWLLVTGVAAEQWVTLARASLVDWNVSEGAVRGLLAVMEGEDNPLSEHHDDTTVAAASRIVTTSLLTRVAGNAFQGSPTLLGSRLLAGALALLAMLEAEPALVASARARSVMRLVARHIVGDESVVANVASGRPIRQAPHGQEQDGPANYTHAAHALPARAPTANANDNTDAPPLDDRPRARTQWGGLLFLLHLVHALDLPSIMQRDGALATRSLRWSLHQLGMMLTLAGADEPATLAFVGVAPGARPPSANEPLATAGELAAIREAHIAIVTELRERVNASDEESDAALIQRITRRSAEILVEPAWFEIRLALAGLSTEVRRAGLDLDPGWIPWLGAVVRFVYV